LTLPIGRNFTGWPRYRLIEWVVLGRSQRRTFDILFGTIVPEPVFAGFKAADDRMTGFLGMVRGVLRGRAVAAVDVPALRTATEVKPPTRPAPSDAIGASGAGRCRVWIYACDHHLVSLFLVAPTILKRVVVELAKVGRVFVKATGKVLHLVEILAVITRGRFLFDALAHDAKLLTAEFGDFS
jgi:hypothetical protein